MCNFDRFYVDKFDLIVWWLSNFQREPVLSVSLDDPGPCTSGYSLKIYHNFAFFTGFKTWFNMGSRSSRSYNKTFYVLSEHSRWLAYFKIIL